MTGILTILLQIAMIKCVLSQLESRADSARRKRFPESAEIAPPPRRSPGPAQDEADA